MPTRHLRILPGHLEKGQESQAGVFDKILGLVPGPFFCALGKTVMPYVNVRITKNGLTREKKLAIVEQITTTLVHVLGKQPEHTHIVIDEVDDENWGYAGMLTDDYRRQEQ